MMKKFIIILVSILIQGLFMEMKTKQYKKDIYTYNLLPADAIKPKGWIWEQLHNDLTKGYVGVYNKVHSTVNKNVFVNQDRHSKRKFLFRKEWWNGEHEGYWKDAVTRMAFLTNNLEYQQLTKKWVEDIINHTGKNGYIGIYTEGNGPTCRFNHLRGNGELWTTSRILMALLAYYEFTNDKTVLESTEKAVHLVMEQYSDKNYFSKIAKGGGVSHGVGFFEILEWLYRITNNNEYLAYSVKLYNDFNNGRVRDDDLKTELLLDKDRLFEKHGAHIAEGLFVPSFIAAITKEKDLREAAHNTMIKLKQHLTPGGAMRCNEWIKGRKGTADEAYEYCGITEMISSLNRIISITGNLIYADWLETMAFNAAQGARFPILSAVSYLTKDNRIKINHKEIGKRESYDAAHLAAACCALNGARLMPYYIEGMWMKHSNNNGLTAMLLGPCELNTSIKNVPVNIREETNYPFSDNIKFTINPAEKITFPLIIRKPYGCVNIEIEKPQDTKLEQTKDVIIFSKTWQKGDEITLIFNFPIEMIHQPKSKTVKKYGVYIKRGPLVYALPFKPVIDTAKEYQNSGFYRYKIVAADTTNWKLQLNKKDPFVFIPDTTNTIKDPWNKPVLKIRGILRDKKNNKYKVNLVPMGNTIFRRVTFTANQINKKL